MLSYDKVVAGMLPEIKNTIDTLVNRQEIGKLEKWLQDCESEIERRRNNAYNLWCEKYYLMKVLGKSI